MNGRLASFYIFYTSSLTPLAGESNVDTKIISAQFKITYLLENICVHYNYMRDREVLESNFEQNSSQYRYLNF